MFSGRVVYVSNGERLVALRNSRVREDEIGHA
jgi:hypothetical protein